MRTIISYYYIIKSKFPPQQYISWMNNFFNIQTNMIIFTNKYTYNLLFKNVNRKNIIFEILEIKDFYVYKYYDYFKKDYLRDREKNRHSPELYMIWNNKMDFVDKSIKKNPFKSEWFCCVDIGYFRNSLTMSRYKHWPKINKLSSDKSTLLLITPFSKKEINTKKGYLHDFSKRFSTIAGGFIIGKSESLLKWKVKYFETMEMMMKNDMFIGKDQNNIANAYLQNQSFCNLILGKHIDPKDIYSNWWWMRSYLS